jgi:hypothetical protein
MKTKRLHRFQHGRGNLCNRSAQVDTGSTQVSGKPVQGGNEVNTTPYTSLTQVTQVIRDRYPLRIGEIALKRIERIEIRLQYVVGTNVGKTCVSCASRSRKGGKCQFTGRQHQPVSLVWPPGSAIKGRVLSLPAVPGPAGGAFSCSSLLVTAGVFPRPAVGLRVLDLGRLQACGSRSIRVLNPKVCTSTRGLNILQLKGLSSSAPALDYGMGAPLSIPHPRRAHDGHSCTFTAAPCDAVTSSGRSATATRRQARQARHTPSSMVCASARRRARRGSTCRDGGEHPLTGEGRPFYSEAAPGGGDPKATPRTPTRGSAPKFSSLSHKLCF